MAKQIAIIVTVVFAIIGAGMIWLLVSFWQAMKGGDEHARQAWADQASGKAYFAEFPNLLAVAQAIAANNPEAIRATAKAVPNLNSPPEQGATLLYSAVTQTWQHPALVESVKTLLALGADPNYTNGDPNSFAMAASVHSTADVLRVMLDAGGNPKARTRFNEPIVCQIWYLGYHEKQARARLDLLLERGADVNSTIPPERGDGGHGGYSLLLYRTKMGTDDPAAYADALALLQRGADPNLAGADGMTFAKMLSEHRARQRANARPEFKALWDWAAQHGIVSGAS